nr:uncharacterized protein LOC131796617 isoform X1 [Pocillopora verrucosa]XP_058970194.1 uncharacterized protein LOC131796617 isoform X1 [Pocillopora verrucosa]
MEFFKCLTQLDGCRLNFLILQRVIREMTNLLQPTGADNHFQQIRIGIKACVLMIPLLGVTWLFGLLLPVHKAFAYIFTILNSIQDNYTRKSSQVNPSEVGDIKAVELQSFAKFESKSHLTGSSQLEITVNYLVQVLTAISRLRSV